MLLVALYCTYCAPTTFLYTLHSSQVMLWGLKRAMSGYLVIIKTHNLNYHKLSQKQVVIQVNIISYGSARRSIWPPELGSCQLVQVPCLGGCEPCQGWLCPRRRWRGEREGRGCLQGSGLWELLVTLALFEFKADGCMKLEDDRTPGTRPERPRLSWSAIDTLCLLSF